MTAPLVVGFGVTGQALVRFLAAGGPVPAVVADRASDRELEAARDLGVALEVAPGPDRLDAMVAAASMVVPSPGVPAAHPVFSAASHHGVPVVSEIELGWRALEQRGPERPRLLAITGTNGKTTVTTDTAAVLAASGMRVATAGNIGTPLVDVAGQDLDVVVAEVSSFQLAATHGWHPDVSCWLNFSPDHLDWHPDLGDYAAAKARIWANQGPGDTTVINLDDPVVTAAAATVPDGVRTITFSTREPADYYLDGTDLVEGEGRVLAAATDLHRALPHDLANSLAVLAVARAAGATEAGCRQALRAARPLPHRVELVATDDRGVRWYDDSKATTPASVLAAVAGFDSVVLVAGGRNKGLDLRALTAAVPPVRAVVAIGESAEELTAAFGEVIPVDIASTMDGAVARAGELAGPGDVVVLSPGAASFDWYRSYAERGDAFAAAVRRHVTRGVQPW